MGYYKKAVGRKYSDYTCFNTSPRYIDSKTYLEERKTSLESWTEFEKFLLSQGFLRANGQCLGKTNSKIIYATQLQLIHKYGVIITLVPSTDSARFAVFDQETGKNIYWDSLSSVSNQIDYWHMDTLFDLFCKFWDKFQGQLKENWGDNCQS